MIHIAYRLAFIVTLGVALCWLATQEQRINRFEMVSQDMQDNIEMHDDFLRQDFSAISSIAYAHNSACKMIDMLLVNAGFEVQKDE